MTNALAIYENFQQTRAIAESLAASDLVPDHFKRKPSNVIIALEFAHRNDIPPFQAMQSLFVVSGKLGMSASMAIALAVKCGALKKIRYEEHGSGESYVVTAIGTLADDTEIKSSISMAQARAANWTKNPLYSSIPDQMLSYRAATFLIRKHIPWVLYGMQTVEELQDVDAAKRAEKAEPVKKIELPPVVIEAPVSELKEHEQSIDITAKKEELIDVLTNMQDAWFENLNQKRDVMLQQIVNENDHNKISRMYDYVKERV